MMSKKIKIIFFTFFIGLVIFIDVFHLFSQDSDLLKSMPVIIIGTWCDVEHNNHQVGMYGITFLEDKTYIEGFSYMGAAYYGTWDLNENELLLKSKYWFFIKSDETEEYEVDENGQKTVIIGLTVKDRDEITLNYPNGKSVTLKRME
jgi:hypothetical protein